MSIGNIKPTTIEDITIIQSRLENLKIVWQRKLKKMTMKAMKSWPTSKPKPISKSTRSLFSEEEIRVSNVLTKPKPWTKPKKRVAKNTKPMIGPWDFLPAVKTLNKAIIKMEIGIKSSINLIFTFMIL